MSDKLSDRLRRAQEALPALLDEAVLLTVARQLSKDLKDAAQLAELHEAWKAAHPRANAYNQLAPGWWRHGKTEEALLAFDTGVEESTQK